MSLAKAFYLLKDAEVRTKELYAMVGLSISVTQPELSDLFNDLAEEEDLHARQIELLRNVFLECQDAFLENPEAEKSIAEFVQKVDMIRNYFNQHYAQLQAADLINLALDIECDLVERHRTFLFQVTDGQVKKLFESLNLEDKAHIGRLQGFKAGAKPNPGA
jgi:rubrerythrin